MCFLPLMRVLRVLPAPLAWVVWTMYLCLAAFWHLLARPVAVLVGFTAAVLVAFNGGIYWLATDDGRYFFTAAYIFGITLGIDIVGQLLFIDLRRPRCRIDVRLQSCRWLP